MISSFHEVCLHTKDDQKCSQINPKNRLVGTTQLLSR